MRFPALFSFAVLSSCSSQHLSLTLRFALDERYPDNVLPALGLPPLSFAVLSKTAPAPKPDPRIFSATLNAANAAAVKVSDASTVVYTTGNTKPQSSLEIDRAGSAKVSSAPLLLPVRSICGLLTDCNLCFFAVHLFTVSYLHSATCSTSVTASRLIIAASVPLVALEFFSIMGTRPYRSSIMTWECLRSSRWRTSKLSSPPFKQKTRGYDEPYFDLLYSTYWTMLWPCISFSSLV